MSEPLFLAEFVAESTTERIVPDAEADSWNLHVHLLRYQYAGQSLRPTAEVLDYGCGTGYGLQHLAQRTTGHCVGVDKPEVVRYAAQRYPAANIEFVGADLTLPQTRYGHFDLIVSFDVIEHVAPLETYLANIVTQLRDEQSVALISTPWSARRNNLFPLHNAHHLCEYTFGEFFALLERYFQIDELLLNMGMVARLRKKSAQSRPVATFYMPLSNQHLLAMEEAYEQACAQVEQNQPLLENLSLLNQQVIALQQQRPNPPAPALTRKANPEYVIRLLDSDTTLRTAFIADHANLCAIDLQFATYNRLNTAHLHFVLERAGVQVAQVTQPALLCSDHCPTRFIFPPIPDSQGCQFQLRLSAEQATAQNSVGVWSTPALEPRFATYYRRFRWAGHPSFNVLPEFIAGVQTLDRSQLPTVNPTQSPTQSTASAPPAVEQHPWPANAPLISKFYYALKGLGLRATGQEIVGYLRWRLRNLYTDRK
jgi:2-polyprenyl-3-methyl-5-hydroxy-6-metoxy-1,4-benzoquinol methylase